MRGLVACVVVLGALAGPGAASALAAFNFTVGPPVAEGEPVTVTVTRESFVDGISASVSTADGTATSPADYAGGSRTVTFVSPLTLVMTVSIPTAPDALDENPETFTVALDSAPTATKPATINDDPGDLPPTLSIGGASVTEGTGAASTMLRFPLTLSAASGRAVTAAFATADGTATAGQDYAATSGSVSIPAGSTTATVSVAVAADGVHESDETLTVTLSNPGGVNLGTPARATGRVIDDDPLSTPAAKAPQPDAGPKPPTPSAPRDRTAPRVTLSKITSSRGVIRISVSCPADERVCRGTLTILSVPAPKSKLKALRRETKLASSLFVVPGGKQANLTLRPSQRVAKLIRRARSIRARAHAVARDGAGNIGTAQARGTVRAGKGSRR